MFNKYFVRPATTAGGSSFLEPKKCFRNSDKMIKMFANRAKMTLVSDTVDNLKTNEAAEVAKISRSLIVLLQLNLSIYLYHGVSSRSV